MCEDRLYTTLKDALSDVSTTPVVVAVSGGGDSVALFHLAHCWARETSTPLHAVTVDHGLRPEAASEIKLVETHCAALNVPHQTLRWDGKSDQNNLMAAAREGRMQLMADWASAQGIGIVLLGHTQDDVAETFLMRLGRSAGLDGLSAMKPRFERFGISWARPLLGVARADLRVFLRQKGMSWAEDPTNEDTRFDRARLRAAQPQLSTLGLSFEKLAHSAEALSEARAALNYYAVQAAVSYVEEDRGDLILRLPSDMPATMKRLLFAEALRWISGARYAPRRDSLSRILKGQYPLTLSGCLITQEKDGVRVTREHNAISSRLAPADELWDDRWQIDGPLRQGDRVKPLGSTIRDYSDWRASGMPRMSLMASPSIWRNGVLIAAPLLEPEGPWRAQIVASFQSFLLSR